MMDPTHSFPYDARGAARVPSDTAADHHWYAGLSDLLERFSVSLVGIGTGPDKVVASATLLHKPPVPESRPNLSKKIPSSGAGTDTKWTHPQGSDSNNANRVVTKMGPTTSMASTTLPSTNNVVASSYQRQDMDSPNRTNHDTACSVLWKTLSDGLLLLVAAEAFYADFSHMPQLPSVYLSVVALLENVRSTIRSSTSSSSSLSIPTSSTSFSPALGTDGPIGAVLESILHLVQLANTRVFMLQIMKEFDAALSHGEPLQWTDCKDLLSSVMKELDQPQPSGQSKQLRVSLQKELHLWMYLLDTAHKLEGCR